MEAWLTLCPDSEIALGLALARTLSCSATQLSCFRSNCVTEYACVFDGDHVKAKSWFRSARFAIGTILILVVYMWQSACSSPDFDCRGLRWCSSKTTLHVLYVHTLCCKWLSFKPSLIYILPVSLQCVTDALVLRSWKQFCFLKTTMCTIL